MGSKKPEAEKPKPEFNNTNVIPTLKTNYIDVTTRQRVMNKFTKPSANDNESKPTNINPNIPKNNNRDITQQNIQNPNTPTPENHKPDAKSEGKLKRLFGMGSNNDKPNESSAGSDIKRKKDDMSRLYQNAPFPPVPTKDQVPTPAPNSKTSQNPKRSSSLPPTKEKNSGSQPNTAPHSPSPLSNPQASSVHKETNTQLPQQMRIEGDKEKGEKLLKTYNEMLFAITKFKTSQGSKKAEIKALQTKIEQLRHQKIEHAGEIKKLQVELYDLLKQVKVTDDDLSTIQKKLAALSGKLSNFPPNSKKSFNRKGPKKPEVIKFFQECWTDNLKYTPETRRKTVESITNLFEEQQEIDYALVSVLVEKLVMDYFVVYIFDQPIYLDFDEINGSYETIQKLFEEAKHPEWVSNLRLKCVKATLTDIEDGGDATTMSKRSRARLCDLLLDKLSAIYDREEISSRIRKLVEMAADLSFPMNSQEECIERKFLLPHEDFFTNQVKAQYGSDKSPTKVKLGISPVFLVKNSIHMEDNIDEYEDDHFMDEDEHEEDADKPNIGHYEPYNKNEYTLVYAGRAVGYGTESQQEGQGTKLEITLVKPDEKPDEKPHAK